MAGNYHVRETRMQLTGQTEAWPTSRSEFQFKDVASRIGSRLDLSDAEILAQFTLVPLNRWLKGHRIENSDLLSTSLSFNSVLPEVAGKNNIQNYTWDLPKWCVLCYADDLRSVGLPSWHLAHQCEYVTVCRLHRIGLIQNCRFCYAKIPSRKYLELPDVLCRACGRAVTVADLAETEIRQIDHTIAEIVQEIIDRQRMPPPGWKARTGDCRVGEYVSQRLKCNIEDYQDFLEERHNPWHSHYLCPFIDAHDGSDAYGFTLIDRLLSFAYLEQLGLSLSEMLSIYMGDELLL
jgi:hypothetical protein